MLRDRLIGGVSSPRHGFDVEFDPGALSLVPSLLRTYTDHPGADEFVTMSQQMANHLYESQPRISPQGILTMMECDVGSNVALAIMKIEKQEGARLIKTEAGKRTFDIRYFRDLILTPRTKLFKLALLVRISDDFEGRACDNQRGYTSYKELADFFLHKFLGCRMSRHPSVATKTFYEATAEFLNQTFKDDPEKHSEIYLHLVSELIAENNVISPQKFYDKYVPKARRQAFLEHLRSRGLSSGALDVDLKLIAPRLRKAVYNFQSGTSLIVPSEQVADRVELDNQEDGTVRVEFTDRLTDLKGK